MPEPYLIAPAGELDVHASRDLAPALNQAAGAPGRDLVVDLSQVTFIDSTGLGAIVQAHQRLRRQGRTLAIVAPKGSAAAMLLELSGLHHALEIFGTREEAGAPRPA